MLTRRDRDGSWWGRAKSTRTRTLGQPLQTFKAKIGAAGEESSPRVPNGIRATPRQKGGISRKEQTLNRGVI
jgi:hypothetical protein